MVLKAAASTGCKSDESTVARRYGARTRAVVIKDGVYQPVPNRAIASIRYGALACLPANCSGMPYFIVVRTGRVELPWPFGRQILSLVRLPVPPRSRAGLG